MAFWNKTYLINGISLRSFCILVVLLQALANWLEAWLVRSGLFRGFVKSESCSVWCEAVQPFQAANPCKKASCFQCHIYMLLMRTCSPGGRDSTRPVGTEPKLVLGFKLLEFWASAWMSPSSSPVCFKIYNAQRSKFLKVSFSINCLISFTDRRNECHMST